MAEDISGQKHAAEERAAELERRVVQAEAQLAQVAGWPAGPARLFGRATALHRTADGGGQSCGQRGASTSLAYAW